MDRDDRCPLEIAEEDAEFEAALNNPEVLRRLLARKNAQLRELRRQKLRDLQIDLIALASAAIALTTHLLGIW